MHLLKAAWTVTIMHMRGSSMQHLWMLSSHAQGRTWQTGTLCVARLTYGSRVAVLPLPILLLVLQLCVRHWLQVLLRRDRQEGYAVVG